VAAYDPELWSDFFVATAGAAAALTGLLFVAVSINLDRILSFRGLPSRALATLVLLLEVTVVSIFALAPGQSTTAIGIEVLIVGSLAALIVLRQFSAAYDPEHQTRGQLAGHMVLGALGVIPFAVAGLSLLAETGGGFYWVLAGAVGAIVGGVANAWVLLVEILR
jgi:modulator of FtsH protease